MYSWNQPVPCNKGKVSCLRKQQGCLKGFKLKSDRQFTDFKSNWLIVKYPKCHVESESVPNECFFQFKIL